MADGHSSNTRPAMGNLIDERRLERITKGFANAQRIRILQLIENDPELSLGDICDRLEIELTNGYEHIRKLTIAGLLVKRRQKHFVHHRITRRGEHALMYLRSIR